VQNYIRLKNLFFVAKLVHCCLYCLHWLQTRAD